VSRGQLGTRFMAADDFAHQMLTRNFAVIDLPEPLAHAVNQLLSSESVGFFSSDSKFSLEAPQQTENGAPSYRGYFGNAHREVLFTRLSDGSALPAAEQLPSLSTACQGLHQLGCTLLQQLAEALQLPEDAFTKLLEQPEHQGELASIMSLFQYRPAADGAVDDAPCPEHVDYTLLTLVPCAATPGLEVLDLMKFEWCCPELPPVGRPAQSVVVMAGEVLEFVTRGRVSATTHRVATRFGPEGRRSCPYLLHAAHEAQLIRWPADAAEAVPKACDFVLDSQLKKTSAVYGN